MRTCSFHRTSHFRKANESIFTTCVSVFDLFKFYQWGNYLLSCSLSFFPTFIGSTGFTCAKQNYTECSRLLMITTPKHANRSESFLFFKINNQFRMGGKWEFSQELRG